MYGSKAAMCRNAHALNGEYVRISKIGIYENPYTVTGCIKHTGSKQAPKSIYTEKVCRNVGDYEHAEVENSNKAVASRACK